MTTSKYFDIQALRIGLLFGLIGGGLMFYLGFADFRLYYIHGYLFIINYLLMMIAGLAMYKNLAKGNSTFYKRFLTAILIYSQTTLGFFLNALFFNKFNSERTWVDKLFVPLIILMFGLFLSSIFAIMFKPKKFQKPKNNYT